MDPGSFGCEHIRRLKRTVNPTPNKLYTSSFYSQTFQFNVIVSMTDLANTHVSIIAGTQFFALHSVGTISCVVLS